MRQFWLAKKSNKKVALYPHVDGKEVKFKIVGDGYEEMPGDFDPSKGSIKRAIVTCPVCGSVIESKTLRSLFKEGKNGERLVAVVLHNPKQRGKKYRVATEKDVEIFREAEKYLEKKREEFIDKWGFDPVPDEPLPPKGTLGFRIQGYGMDKWGDLFNARQKLALITFVEKTRQAHERMLEQGMNEEYVKVVGSYLSIIMSKLSSTTSLLCRWNNISTSIAGKPDQTARMEMKMKFGKPILYLRMLLNVALWVFVFRITFPSLSFIIRVAPSTKFNVNDFPTCFSLEKYV